MNASCYNTQEISVSMTRLIAFINSHDSKVVSHTATTISATVEEHNGVEWATVIETFPATLSAARDFLGY